MPIFDVSTRRRIFSHITSCASRTLAAGPDIKHTRSVVPATTTDYHFTSFHCAQSNEQVSTLHPVQSLAVVHVSDGDRWQSAGLLIQPSMSTLSWFLLPLLTGTVLKNTFVMSRYNWREACHMCKESKPTISDDSVLLMIGWQRWCWCLICALTVAFDMFKSSHQILSMHSWHCIWKLCTRCASVTAEYCPCNRHADVAKILQCSSHLLNTFCWSLG